MNLFRYIPLVTSILSLLLGVIVTYSTPKKTSTRIFHLFCITTAYFSFVNYCARTAINLNTASIWAKLSAPWPITLALILHFMLNFTKKWRHASKKRIFIVIYLPALIISILNMTTNYITSAPIQTAWGWIYSISNTNIALLVCFIWIIVICISSIFLCLNYFNNLSKIKRSLALSVFTGNLLILLFILIEFLVPINTSYPVNLIQTGFFIWAMFIGYAILKFNQFSLPLKNDTHNFLITHKTDEVYNFLERDKQKVVDNQMQLRTTLRGKSQFEESAELYRDLIENSSELIQSIAPDGSFLYINKSWIKTIGYSRKELRKMSIFDIVHPNFLLEYQNTFDKILRGDVITNF